MSKPNDEIADGSRGTVDKNTLATLQPGIGDAIKTPRRDGHQLF